MKFSGWKHIRGVLLCGLAAVSVRAQVQVGGSPFYEFGVVTETGGTAAAPGGLRYTLRQVNAGLAVNDHGLVAVPVRVSQGGSNAPAVLLELPGQPLPILAQRPPWDDWIRDEALEGPAIQSVDYVASGQFAFDRFARGIGLLPAATVWRGVVTDGNPVVFDIQARTGPGQPSFTSHAAWPKMSGDGTVAFFTASYGEFATTGSPQTNHVAVSKAGSPEFSNRRHRLLAGMAEDPKQANFPVIGQHEVFAMVKGQRTNDAAVIRVDETGAERVIASTASGWRHFGWYADLSQDSKFVTFLGRRDNGQEGIFLSIFDAAWGSSEPRA